MKYQEWLNSTLDAVLTICHVPSFGDDSLPPIYLDIGEHKPKWELVKGKKTITQNDRKFQFVLFGGL
jgi:hypothetical protein